MKTSGLILLGFLAAATANADILTFTLDPSVESGYIYGYPFSVAFTGSVTFNSTLNTCDGGGVDCLDLNNIALDPSVPLPSFLTLEDAPFYFIGSLSDDGVFNSVLNQEIFDIQIHPEATAGVYNGRIDIFGALDDTTNLTNLLATANFTVVVIPEPSAWFLGLLGLAALFWARRVAT